MRNSIEDLIRVARGNAVEDFKLRFMQKWYETTPCFHWKELNLSSEIKALVITENPSIWLSNSDEELDIDDKIWEKNELDKVRIFDWIKESIAPLEKSEQSIWLENNIKTTMEKFGIHQENLVLCYYEGTTPFSKEWRAHFEKKLKV
jgi:hypothetical protein